VTDTIAKYGLVTNKLCPVSVTGEAKNSSTMCVCSNPECRLCFVDLASAHHILFHIRESTDKREMPETGNVV
jgi:hypothetical protein